MKVITASVKRCNKRFWTIFQQCMSEYRAGIYTEPWLTKVKACANISNHKVNAETCKCYTYNSHSTCHKVIATCELYIINSECYCWLFLFLTNIKWQNDKVHVFYRALLPNNFDLLHTLTEICNLHCSFSWLDNNLVCRYSWPAIQQAAWEDLAGGLRPPVVSSLVQCWGSVKTQYTCTQWRWCTAYVWQWSLQLTLKWNHLQLIY